MAEHTRERVGRYNDCGKPSDRRHTSGGQDRYVATARLA
jgi:hypothetical protein